MSIKRSFCKQLFNRILCVCDSPTKLKTYLEYELSGLIIFLLIDRFDSSRKALLFAHAMTGCDTTSYFFDVEKLKAIEMLKSSEIQKVAEILLKDS
jgi:hypothetical protein